MSASNAISTALILFMLGVNSVSASERALSENPQPNKELLTWRLTPTVAGNAAVGFAPSEDSVGSVVRLSNEQAIPFAMLDKAPSENDPNKLARSLTQFPCVQSCLTVESQAQRQPDLTSFSWSVLDGTEDATVCLFRLITSYREISDFEAWLKHQGFSVRAVSVKRDSKDFLWGVSLSGQWSIKKNGWPFKIDWGSGLKNLFGNHLLPPPNLFIGAGFDPKEGLYRISINYNYK